MSSSKNRTKKFGSKDRVSFQSLPLSTCHFNHSHSLHVISITPCHSCHFDHSHSLRVIPLLSDQLIDWPSSLKLASDNANSAFLSKSWRPVGLLSIIGAVISFFSNCFFFSKNFFCHSANVETVTGVPWSLFCCCWWGKNDDAGWDFFVLERWEIVV